MTLISFISAASQALGTAESVWSFINKEAPQVLADVGRAHYSAGLSSFRYAQRSLSPQYDLAASMSSLREAYSIYMDLGWKYCRSLPLERWGKSAAAYEKAVEVCILLAFCYLLLGDTGSASRVLAEDGIVSMDYYLNSKFYALGPRSSATGHVYSEKTYLKRFCSMLGVNYRVGWSTNYIASQMDEAIADP